MAEISERRNLPQYINFILQKKIQESLQNSRQNSRSKNTSVHSHSQKTIPTSCFVQNKHHTAQNKQNRKVCFKQINGQKQEESKQKLKFTLNASFKHMSTKKHLKKNNPVSINTIKSLNSSFAWGGNEVEQNHIDLSLRYYNPELHECKLLVNEILKKLQIFDDSKFSDKQMIPWLEGYFQKEKAILGKIFLRRVHTYHHTKKITQIQIQRNRETLYQKVGLKQKDLTFKNSERFIKAAQLQQYDKFLQTLYVEKSKIKMKQIEQSVTKKMSFVCKQIREQQNSNYLCTLRRKPTDIANFITDLKTFENELGSLKRISKINRSRFKLLNEADLLVEMHALRLNQNLCELMKEREVQTVYN